MTPLPRGGASILLQEIPCQGEVYITVDLNRQTCLELTYASSNRQGGLPLRLCWSLCSVSRVIAGEGPRGGEGNSQIERRGSHLEEKDR